MKLPTSITVRDNRISSPCLGPDWSAALSDCSCCPRECHADRASGRLGYCRTAAGFSVASICAHRGEEPVISGTHGICNIFFTRCNMQCVYCQNYEISRTRGLVVEHLLSLEDLVARIEKHLDAGCKSVGFVSPSHVLPQVKAIMTALWARGRRPVFVYNTNAFDKTEAIRSLEGMIDVYLPDLKYMDRRLTREFSDTPDYPDVAAAAIKEMFRQKGAEIRLDDDGLITSGLIIRHLVLPGHIENSKAALRFIARQLSPDIHISLMSQFNPTPAVTDHPDLGRRLTSEEYDEVVEELERLGFHRGFLQELSSAEHYCPSFENEHPFE
ncbi:MAG TPA: radical SAM protein [Candidatus Deferrimicrobium sp.]|nr:radical SAM protein [Candidatus Deferrimicrobium sp.]